MDTKLIGQLVGDFVSDFVQGLGGLVGGIVNETVQEVGEDGVGWFLAVDVGDEVVAECGGVELDRSVSSGLVSWWRRSVDLQR